MRSAIVTVIAGLALAACNSEVAMDEASDADGDDAATVTASEDNAAADSEGDSEAEAPENETADGDQAASGAVIAPQPVRYGIDGPDLDSCTGTGEVTGLKASGDGFLSVRAAPDVAAKELARLKNGQSVSFCDSAKGESWIGIVYDPTGTADCGTGSPIAATKPYDGPCKSGWVSAKYVNLIAG